MYVGNDYDMWEVEVVYICGKRFKYVRNCLDVWETAEICVKLLKYMENGLDMWEKV